MEDCLEERIVHAKVQRLKKPRVLYIKENFKPTVFARDVYIFLKARLTKIHNYFSPSKRPTYQRGSSQWT